ncbi:MAG TPA: PEGA domain-containing protein [Bryobacteraceae bacterium]|nr:PEGA domain-containing protein [Bryobacteraceae bacterium]
MKCNALLAALFTASMAMAQVMIPDGTKIRVRLEENLSSETAEAGEVLDFAVTQEVRVGDAVVIANGARATGNIIKAEHRRRLGRAGYLDFSIERVQMVDGNWLNVRYTPSKNHGKGNGTAAGVTTGILAVVFWPAAPLGLLIKGHDVEINKGRIYDVFADESTYVASAVAASTPLMTRALPQAPAMMLRQANGAPANNGGLPPGVNAAANPVVVSNVSMLNTAQPQPAAQAAGGTALLTVNANRNGADIEVDGMFVGNAPTTIPLAGGMHQLVVRQGSAVWQRNIQITGGTVTIDATLERAAVQRASR